MPLLKQLLLLVDFSYEISEHAQSSERASGSQLANFILVFLKF